jgi:alkylation response protein AidB-like acyl-CoA dehydrogenase
VVDTDARSQEDPDPVRDQSTEKQYTLFFDDVFVPGTAWSAPKAKPRPLLLGAQRAHHGAAMVLGTGRYALAKACACANAQGWSVPIGAHQGLAHPLAKPRSSWSWHGS